MGSAYAIIRNILRTTPRITRWLFFEKEDSVMWGLLVFILSVTANSVVVLLLRDFGLESYDAEIIALVSPLTAMFIYRLFLTAENRQRAELEFIRKYGKLIDTMRLRSGWLVGIYRLNDRIEVVPVEDVEFSAWRKFMEVFKELRYKTHARSVEEVKRLLENF